MTRKEYEQVIKHPGKFEGQPVYVPYFWEVYLDGRADHDDDTVLSFNVIAEDKAIFPELKRRKTVRLMEDSQGFVIEA